MNKRASWTTRFGFYLAAMGASVGLGNLWRFPYVVEANGGGAFVFLYVLLAFVVGLPLLVAELMIGKVTRKSAVSALESINSESRLTDRPVPLEKRVDGKRSHWRFGLSLVWYGRIAVTVSTLLLSYYAVVSGWVLYFFLRFSEAALRVESLDPIRALDALMANGWVQFGISGLHLTVVVLIAAKGVSDGIEKWIGYIMSAFVILLSFLVVQALSLPGAVDAIRFLFYPNFTRVTPNILIQVLGHLFFTMTIGMGAMTAFGSYLRNEVHTPTEGMRVAALDTAISIFAGLLIFPILFSDPSLTPMGGPKLLFETIPLLFSKFGLGPIYGMAFFLCLYCAALGASLGLIESGVSYLVDRRGFSRKKSSQILGVLALALSVLPSLSSSLLKDVTIGGLNLLQIFDSALIEWLLPISALGISIAVGYRLKDSLRRKEFLMADQVGADRLYGNWIFILRWWAPTLILGGLGLRLYYLIRG